MGIQTYKQYFPKDISCKMICGLKNANMEILDSLFDYSIYECSGIDPITKKALTGSIYFLVKGMRISIGDVIKYKNINSEIVRLNWRGNI